MISFLKLIRYKNLLMILLTMVLTKYALIDSFKHQSYLSLFQFIILAISILSITAGGYIINDVFDIEADKINKPNKVFVSKNISINNANIYYKSINALGILTGFFLSLFFKNNFALSFFFIVPTILLFFYSSYFKRKILIGNFLISVLITLPFFLIFIFNIPNKNELIKGDNIQVLKILFTYIFFSFLTTLIREIIKDIEDIDGDLKINARTLPIVIGRKRANRVALGFSVFFLLFLILIIREFLIERWLFLSYSIVFLLLPIGYFIYKLYSAESKKEYSFLSKLIKTIMFFGILSMLLLKFI